MSFGAGAIVDVAVNAGQPARIPFSYRVPEGMCVAVGQAVFVPFGSRVLQGIVLGATRETPEAELRELQSVADEEPVLDEVHIGIARWMSERYLAPLWDCIATCLPPGYGQRPVTMVSPVEIPALLPVQRRDQKILGYLAEHGRLTLESLREAVGNVPMARLERLQELGYLTVTQGLARPRAGPRFERRLRRAKEPGELAVEAAALREGNARSVDGRLLRRLAQEAEITLAEARKLGVTPKHVDRLEEQGWLEEVAVRIERDPVTAYEFNPKARPVLSPDQQAAVDAAWSAETPYLLHGVTGAGKTEVYLELAERTLEQGRSVIILVPEISLTPQAVRRYGERFGRRIGVVHSGLGEGELYDQWFRMHEGDIRLVLGSRSAAFAPVQDPGLIVIDEEHEPSYKQSDPQPRYHARAVAEELARRTDAKLIMGSATPDIISYHRAQRGEFGLATLGDRLSPGGDEGFATILPPRVEVTDMREELRAGNRGVFSRRLVQAARSALSAKEQVLLFVNRRGSARFILCRDCGAVAECPSCGVAMSLQADEGALPRIVCHHCGRSRKLDQECPKCGSARYRPFGVGTQRIEQEARRGVPGAAWRGGIARRRRARAPTTGWSTGWKPARSTSSWGPRCSRRGSTSGR
ncbi:MAG: primosomal protein N' [Dehalococcoidia bacterium]|nr:primosomal protein N' [Dehalococcoidia bacterium]